MSRFRLDGQIALVTGAGGGIGSAGALALAEAGADVALLGRDRSRLEETAHRVTQTGGRAQVVEADVTDERQVEAAVALVERGLGPVDILFNSAGVTSPKPMRELPVAEFRRVIDVNLTGAFLCVRAVAPGMRDRRRGRIVNMGSILSGRGMATRSAYAASKAALANLGAALCFELGPCGVTVNTIGATVIATDLNRPLIQTQPELYAQILRRTALARLGGVEDVTGLLVFLASPAAAFITGQTIYVDGGYTAG